jgi:hypothetical protein
MGLVGKFTERSTISNIRVVMRVLKIGALIRSIDQVNWGNRGLGFCLNEKRTGRPLLPASEWE